MFKTNKDVVFYSFILIWLFGGTILVVSTNLDANIINLLFLSIIGILVIVKFLNRKFALWLEKPLKNNEVFPS